VLEVVLNRLSEFMEKAQKIKGKVVAAMFYPAAVITVATVILGILMVFVVPKFQAIFADLLGGEDMPGFTLFVLRISNTIKDYTIWTPESLGFPIPGPVIWAVVALVVLFRLTVRTKIGRKTFDKFKLHFPLVSSGVPILQALTIVKETSGNVIVGDAVGAVHESVKEGETITAPLEASNVFPPMVISMVDVGEQTGALPEMLMKIADNYDDEVDNAVSAMTSLLEPIMIVFLAVVVGSIVIALFLPLITLIDKLGSDNEGRKGGE
jgi:type IV pilus assembly protein PilC